MNDAANQHDQRFYQGELARLQRELQARKDANSKQPWTVIVCASCGASQSSLNERCARCGQVL